MLNSNHTLFYSLCLLVISATFFQCDDDDADIVFDHCLVEEIIDNPYELGDTIRYFTPDTFTHLIIDELIVERLRNNQPYQEIGYNESGDVVFTRLLKQGDWYTLDSFFYENQQLTTRRIYSKDGELRIQHDFNWENNKLKSGFAMTYVNVDGQEQRQDSKYNFQYTGDNITEVMWTFYKNNGDSLMTRTTFEFDSENNFWNYLPLGSSGATTVLSLERAPYRFSANNVTEETRSTINGSWIGGRSYSYTWDNGLVKAFVLTSRTNTSSDLFVHPVQLSYECW